MPFKSSDPITLAASVYKEIGKTYWSYYSTRIDMCSHRILLAPKENTAVESE